MSRFLLAGRFFVLRSRCCSPQEWMLRRSGTELRCFVKHTSKLRTALQSRYPGQRGFSSRCVRRFCQEQGIRRLADVDDDGLDDAVRHRILLVGHGYGRKTMTGLLAAAGIRVGEHRVGQSLRRVAPQHQALRAHVAYRMRNLSCTRHTISATSFT